MSAANPTQTPCVACGSQEGVLISSVDGKTGQSLQVVQCCGCGLGRQDPMPTAEALAQWYSKKYRQDYKTSVTPRLTHVLRAARLALQRWNWAQRKVPQLQPRHTLDVGASSGEFVYLMQTRGAQAQGVEPHEGYSNYARETLGVNMRTGALQQTIDALPQRHYDLVSMFHVLEHLTDPIEALRKLARLLTPEGMLLIEVPDNARLSAPKNTFFKAHTLYFTAHSLTSVANAAGLRVVATNFDEESNLLVLLQPDASLPPVRWQPDDSLQVGQRARNWPNYIYQRIKSGYLPKRIAKRREEKAFASQFGNAVDLLRSVY